MKVLFINNNGSGYADHVSIEPGIAVSKFFAQKITDGDPSDYLIRVNRQPVAADYVLQEGDRISITPTKIEGAA